MPRKHDHDERFFEALEQRSLFDLTNFASVGLAFARADVSAQTVVEVTYQAQAGWLTVQPDLQLLLLRDRTAGIAGVRVTVAL